MTTSPAKSDAAPPAKAAPGLWHRFGPRAWVLGLIRAYQLLISPMLGPRCRFYPSCSHYAAEAVQCHGLARGSWLAVGRVCRCHPFHPGGYDPVPPGTSAADASSVAAEGSSS